MKKLTGILILATIALGSCNTSRYYFKMRTGGSTERKIENQMEEPKESGVNLEMEKDSSMIILDAPDKEITNKETDTNDSGINSAPAEVKTQLVKKKRILSLKPELKKTRINRINISSPESKTKHIMQKRKENQSSGFDWEEFLEISFEILVALVLIAAGLAMEGALTWATFLSTLLWTAVGAVLFCFLLWLLFHNFVDGIRDSRSRR